VLASCAGISIGERTLDREGHAAPSDNLRRHAAVNLFGLYEVIRVVAAAMARNDPGEDGERGLIVNVASIAGYEGQAGQVAYAATKGAVIAMTLPLARDLAPFGIRVMCVAPGAMDTPMLADLDEGRKEELLRGHLFPKRLGRPAEFGALVAAFAENGFLNGEVVRLDAGLRLTR
jgi:3-hydroxyacyl-CoA dehydrogenase/3-hydroxy-2-methylbutyryl-CoA dehydrogenase